jgi:serine/threonine-protein kinase RsbW
MLAGPDDAFGRHMFAWTYPGDRGRVRAVRAALAPLLHDCPCADDALLVASELAANAAVHSRSAAPGGQFTVRADIRDGTCVWIEVEDQGGPWVRGETADDHPRGLDLVQALAGDGNWGIDGDPERGRVAWARLAWVPDR